MIEEARSLPMGSAMDTGKRHLASLDSLRGVGVILIFAAHFINPFPYILFGWIGLWIFFVLSGYLITDGLLKMRELPKGKYFGRFYAKRAFRILPAFIISFLISVGLYFTFRHGYPRTPPLSSYWIYIVTFTFNFCPIRGTVWFDHLWSLSVEEQFYLIWPWLVFFLPIKWLKRVAPGWLVVAPVLRLILPWFYGEAARPSVVEASLLCQDSLAIGGCVAIFRDKLPRQSKKLLWVLTALVIVVGLINYLAGASPAGSYWRTLGWPGAPKFNYQHVWGFTIINIWAAALILSCLNGTAPFILNFPPLAFLGRISYGAYLYHIPLLGIYVYYLWPIKAFSSRGFLIFLIWFANVIIVSWLSFRLIELPFLRIKNRLGKRQSLLQTRLPPQPAAIDRYSMRHDNSEQFLG